MNDEEIFSLSLDIGKEIIKSGGEISRATDTIIRINKAYGNKCEVFALPSVIIAQSGKNIQIRHIGNQDIDLTELSRLNTLSRRLCLEINEEIQITKRNVYSKIKENFCVCVATGAFSLFFGGGILDAFFAGTIGIATNYITTKLLPFPFFTTNLIGAFISAILAYIPLILGLAVNPDKIIIGIIMLLVPGLTVVNSIRDMMMGDLIAGIFELLSSVMSALAIAFGVAGGIWVMRCI